VLDLSLLKIPTMHATIVGASSTAPHRAMPFLLPLLLQLGFGLTAFQSGLITLSNVVGAMGMKTAVPFILRHFGFRRVLMVNALVSAALVAACATFTPGVSFAWIVGVLIISGFFRSLEFTSLNTIAYAISTTADEPRDLAGRRRPSRSRSRSASPSARSRWI